MEVDTNGLDFNTWCATDYYRNIVNLWTGNIYPNGNISKGVHSYIVVKDEEAARGIWLAYKDCQTANKITLAVV